MESPMKLWKWIVLASLVTSGACGTEQGEPDPGEGEGSPAVEDPILTDSALLFDGAPSNDELPDLAKADQEFPEKFTEVTETQSSVKSQGSRGVCSIFSTVGYMEHLYIAEGTITDPDFSEQYLQWSVKFEVNSFPNTSGSSGYYNLRALSEFGIPEEEAWPYETSQWSSSDDPDCTGDEMPTRCYTNGHPPEEATDAEKYKLPRGSYVSTRTRDIKSHIYNKKQGVIVGLDFFYQSWNHRRSELPTNRDYWKKGYVLYPNDKDKEISLENRAGHSIQLVGWDDNLEVPIVDENGEQLTDENGDPITERGFFLFKNSWGTGSFGAENPYGDGYGWISFRYVEEYGSGRVSDLPEIDVVQEICGDGEDNDGNYATDCDDDACADDPICTESSQIIEADLPTEGLSIPDNDTSGVEVTLEVTDPGEISAFTLNVDISHTYRGDLSLRLAHPDGTTVDLQQNGYDGEDDLIRSFVVEDFVGKSAEGTYRLIVADHAAVDTGTINAVNAEIVR
jgi:C1A family cysteine protease